VCPFPNITKKCHCAAPISKCTFQNSQQGARLIVACPFVEIATVPDQSGASPLYVACVNGHRAVVQSLLACKANTSIAILDTGNTPLHGAAFQGHLSVCELLLENGASLSLISRNGFTPLHVAAFAGHTKIVMLLLQYGASKESKTKRVLVPLHVASNDEIANLLSISETPNAKGLTKSCDVPLGRVGRDRIVSTPWIGARRMSQVGITDNSENGKPKKTSI
jgi:ankyrin repeat protein